MQSDALRRGVRAGIWFSVATFLIEGVELFNLYDFTEAQAQWLTVALGVLLTLAINFAEDNIRWFPALLKAPPSSGQNPVPDATTGSRPDTTAGAQQ